VLAGTYPHFPTFRDAVQTGSGPLGGDASATIVQTVSGQSLPAAQLAASGCAPSFQKSKCGIKVMACDSDVGLDLVDGLGSVQPLQRHGLMAESTCHDSGKLQERRYRNSVGRYICSGTEPANVAVFDGQLRQSEVAMDIFSPRDFVLSFLTSTRNSRPSRRGLSIGMPSTSVARIGPDRRCRRHARLVYRAAGGGDGDTGAR